jgi:hypothetical protein
VCWLLFSFDFDQWFVDFNQTPRPVNTFFKKALAQPVPKKSLAEIPINRKVAIRQNAVLREIFTQRRDFHASTGILTPLPGLMEQQL